MKKTGDRIRMMCMVYSISQRTLSDISGVKLTVINKAARDVYLPGSDPLKKLAHALQVTKPWLAFGTGQIFTKPLVLLNLTSSTRKTRGARQGLLSPREAYNAVDKILAHEGVAACNAVRDEIRSDVRYYVCACNERHIMFAADALTIPGLEQFFEEKKVVVGDENPPNLYEAIELLYSDERDIEKSLMLIARRIGLEHLAEEEITLPERIGSGTKVRILVERMRELKVDMKDIMAAARLYRGDNTIDMGWNNAQSM